MTTCACFIEGQGDPLLGLAGINYGHMIVPGFKPRMLVHMAQVRVLLARAVKSKDKILSSDIAAGIDATAMGHRLVPDEKALLAAFRETEIPDEIIPGDHWFEFCHCGVPSRHGKFVCLDLPDEQRHACESIRSAMDALNIGALMVVKGLWTPELAVGLFQQADRELRAAA